MNGTLQDALAKAVQTNTIPVRYSATAEVIAVHTTPRPRVDVQIDGQSVASHPVLEGVRWFFPGVPREGARCRVVFPNNQIDQAIATDFDLFDEIDVRVADMFHIAVSDSEISLAVAAQPGASETDRIALNSSGNIVLGPEDSLEKAVLGETLKDWLDDLLSIFVENPLTVDVITGPEAASPVLIAKVEAHRAKLDTFLSNKVQVG